MAKVTAAPSAAPNLVGPEREKALPKKSERASEQTRPLFMSAYLVKTRGGKGFLIILGFIGTYLVATIVGIILSVAAAVLSGQQ